MVKVAVINGACGVGKSKFERICQEQCGYFAMQPGFDGIRMLHVDIISSVDFVKEIATLCGWDGSKTLENRKFLSDLKALLIKWNNVPYKVLETRAKTLPSVYDWLMLVDCSRLFLDLSIHGRDKQTPMIYS